MPEPLSNNLPGTRDLLPGETERWRLVEECARRIFERHGYREIRTPVIEPTELFARGIGGDTDIVGKEMYTFRDQSGRSVTLRPEATASVVRAYIQGAMYRGGGLDRLYYLGPMFRHEKKQKGRWRQFYQIGAEAIGSEHPAVDAEIMEMALGILDELGIGAKLLVNSIGCRKCRPAYMDLLRGELGRGMDGFCDDCRRRAETNPLRVFDCKVEGCQGGIALLPVIIDHVCPECAAHFAEVRRRLEGAGIPYSIVPRLVRGLDYYVRTAFEIVSGELGAQNALMGGGRYDGLSEVLGGPPAPAIGFAMGLDRLVMTLPEKATEEARWEPDLFLAHMGEAALDRAGEIARRLRARGMSCIVDFDGGSLKSRMRLANRMGARHVLIVGEEELASRRYRVKRLADGAQWEASLEELEQGLNPVAGT
ncbi:MAG: histidine--tRNA ligase [Acidobacteria bacterium]|nr:histidine--tRNA ligase [Acidobacteriota bacterium]